MPTSNEPIKLTCNNVYLPRPPRPTALRLLLFMCYLQKGS